MPGKWYKDIEGKFNWIGIMPEEEAMLQQYLKEKNNSIMEECLNDSLKFKGPGKDMFGEEVKTNLSPDNSMKITIALFDKRATQFFTVQQAFLDEKINGIMELQKAEKDRIYQAAYQKVLLESNGDEEKTKAIMRVRGYKV